VLKLLITEDKINGDALLQMDLLKKFNSRTIGCIKNNYKMYEK
jgi:hypothetical protein